MNRLQGDETAQASTPAHGHPGTRQEGKVGWLLLWLVGVPVPVLLFFFLLRGCT